MQEVYLEDGTDKKIKIGKKLGEPQKQALVRFLQEHQDCFAWSPDDITLLKS